jgi:hypothetical protein
MTSRAGLLASISAAALLAFPAKAMQLREFETMAADDQYEYVGDVVWAAMKVLKAGGKPDLAAKVHELYLQDHDSDEHAATQSTLSLGKSLVQASAFDADRAAKDPKAHRLTVEDVLRLCLKDEQGIVLPQGFSVPYKPKRPLQGKRGNDDVGFGTPSMPEQFLTVQFLQVALDTRALDEWLRAKTGKGIPSTPPTPTAAPQADCESAKAACSATCPTLQIYDPDREAVLKQSDFKARCERSCSVGSDACKVQDSRNSCSTFVYRCNATCPWTVIDTYVDITVRHSNAFRQCMTACDSGFSGCKETIVRVPARPRTGKFNACQEAQAACYTGCMGVTIHDLDAGADVGESNYPDLCAEACSKGVPACNAAGPAQKCEAFEHTCAPSCPSAITDDNGNALSNTDSLRECQAACHGASDYCGNILR